MTERTVKYTRRTRELPSGKGLDLLVTWANEGPGALAPPLSDEPSHNIRTKIVQQLRRLANGLDVPVAERIELFPVHSRDFRELSDELLCSLAWRARVKGHVTAGCRERTPLTPVQADTLYRTVQGATCDDIANDTGATPSGVHGNLKRMRETHACTHTPHLVACAYRDGWLPDGEELRLLLRGRMVWSVPVPHYGPTDKPPYRWRGDA